MELIFYNPKEGGSVEEIEFNNEEIKAHINQSLEKYQGLIYDDNSIKLAKNDRSTLNTFKKALDAKRSEIKKKYLEPYMRFEAKIKELTTLIDQPLLAIDTQVKEYEGRVKAKKRDDAKAIFDEVMEELGELIKFEAIEDPRWQNTTYNLKNIREELEELRDTMRTGIQIVKDKNSLHETTLMDIFIRTRDLGQVLKKEAELEQTKRLIQAREEMIMADLPKDRIITPQERAAREGAPVYTIEPKEQPTVTLDPPEEKDGKWYTFSLYLSEEQAADLGKWVRENKIEARKVGN